MEREERRVRQYPQYYTNLDSVNIGILNPAKCKVEFERSTTLARVVGVRLQSFHSVLRHYVVL